MEHNTRSSYKRHPDPFFENNDTKRQKITDQSSSDTVYRILCPSRKIGKVIGKSGGIVKSLREETQAKITVADSVPDSEERVIIIYSFSSKKPVKQYNNDNMELHCAAQDALLKVHDRIVEDDTVGGPDNETIVTARLLVPNYTVGCLLGKKGDVIQRLRSETRANIRVLPPDQRPICAMDSDELVQISGKAGIAKRALYEISTLLHQNPRKDEPPVGDPPPDRGGAPWRRRGEYYNEHSRFGPLDFDGFGEIPAEFYMKILCPRAKMGAVIGKGGSNVRQVQQETGTDVHVDDVAGDLDERVIRVSSLEALWTPRSRTIDAILLLQDKTSECSENGTFTTRILLPSSKVGCILGQGGHIINEMRWRTKADIHVYTKDEKPKCAGQDEELVQVSGSYDSCKDALAEIASRYRERCLQDSKPGPEIARRGGRSHGYEPFKGGAREYELYSRRSGPPRDYEPYGYSAPPRDYEPRSLPARPRDYEVARGPHFSRDYEPYRDYELARGPPHSRDYEPRGYRASPCPPMDYEPRGYSSPLRDFEYPPNATRFSGVVDLKMPINGRDSSIGSRVGNASEITRKRPMIQDPYGGGSESIFNSTRDTYRENYPENYAPRQEHYTDLNPSPYHNYQNNPTRQGHYSPSPYQY